MPRRKTPMKDVDGCDSRSVVVRDVGREEFVERRAGGFGLGGEGRGVRAAGFGR